MTNKTEKPVLPHDRNHNRASDFDLGTVDAPVTMRDDFGSVADVKPVKKIDLGELP
jgi:hypothetical protein